MGKRPEPGVVLDGLRGVGVEAGECLNHMGDALWERRRVGEALACYCKAAALGGDPAARAERRWMSWMMLGQFERAWQESDRLERLHRARHGAGAHCHTWDGRPLEGRDVLVRCAHGLGDTIQFARYVPLLRARCRRLTLMAQRELWPLLEGLGGFDRLVASWEVPPDDLAYETEIEVMELPYAFRSTLATLPAAAPYLRVAPELVAAMRRAIDAGSEAGGKKLKVGLVWASSTWNAARSVPLELFAPLARVEGIELYNLQFGPEREEWGRVFPLRGEGRGARGEGKCGMRNAECGIRGEGRGARGEFDTGNWQLATGNSSILDTAALMTALDLVVTPDTLAAHLAGALGRPVWVLLLHQADWRWMAGREDSPWYPTMRLFRQPAPGDWATPAGWVIEGIKKYIDRF